jgi:hypothetical protein
MAGYAPALWVAMVSALLALVVAAHRGAGVRLLPVRLVRALRRR